MNPPSALHSAMSKERKPFTYTPGGLNLSEIKSERMAQRLMRNAMNQGVPEKPVQTIQSPPVLASNAIPNFNCLPVQVFPTFSLPANPKSLLRTRSNPDAPKPAPTNAVPKFCIDSTPNVYSYKNVNKPSILPPNNNSDNNKQPTINDCNTETNDYSFWQPTNYESDTSKFLASQSKMNSDLQSKPSEIITNIMKNKINEDVNTVSNDEDSQIIKKSSILLENSESNDFNSIGTYCPHLQEKKDDDYEKKEVKITKKQTKSNNEADQNGDTEAEIVVKLPSKKSAAKTETTVDVLKKTLPDGTVEEVKTTTTKCTIDGKTEITTKTETRTFPKEVDDTEEIEEQEEEFDEVIEENGQDEDKEGNKDEVKKQIDVSDDVQEEENDKVVEEPLEQSKEQNGHIIIEEEKTEKNTTQKVVISQSAEQESEEEIEEVEEEEDGETEDVSVEQVIILKKSTNSQNQGELNNEEVKDQEVEDDEEIIEDEEVVEEEEEYENEKESNIEKNDKAVKEQIEDKDKLVAPEGDGQSVVENELSLNDDSKPIQDSGNEDESDGEGEVEGQGKGELQSEGEDEDKGEEEFVADKEIQEKIRTVPAENEIADVDIKVTKKETISPDVQDDNDISVPLQQSEKDVEKLSLNNLSSEPIKDNEKHERKEETIIKTTLQYEPSIPLEKVEDVEIKPIGPAQEIFKKSHTEIITTTTDKPIGALSTQTEFNRVENIITVNRTSKTLDHAYEQIAPSSIPTLNTYFTQNNNRILSSPHPVFKPHQPIYPLEPPTERRHSLLLERLSVERQLPTSDIYQNNYHPTQNQEQPQWLQEPQSEVLTVSNVKPSEITKNQQWYQQTKKEESTYNTVTQTPNSPTPQWNKPATLPQVQQHYQPQPQVQAQPQLQPQYQSFAQPQYAPKPEFAPSYTENKTHSKFNNYQQNTYPSYVPKPTWVSSTFDPKPTVPQPDQFSSLKKESTESYQTSTQQLSSSYVPPPWEQDTSYVSNTTNYYQPPPPPATSLTPSSNLAWKPQPSSKFSKPPPTSYVPPAPNQSFVKPVTADDPRLPGRKTYYSEYERRYISVPEATYVPGETKLQTQPDPSPQYYCDINEPTEPVEPQWRRELREFTEKTQTTQTETTSVRPPWEEDSKYTASTDFTAPAPTGWTQTQTLRPRSLRERSYEPEYANSKEWPRTNTLGRGRPQSSYVKSNVETLPQRPRGVSVDRYNPNNYLAPTSEHPPVQSQTMNPNIHPKGYHNPTIPAYHARVSAEPREQPAYIQPRSYIDSRAPPVQSRSFKYLQWITGTED